MHARAMDVRWSVGHGRRAIAYFFLISRSGIGGVKRRVKTPTAVNSLLQSFLVIKSATFVLDLLSYLIIWQIDTKRNFACVVIPF